MCRWLALIGLAAGLLSGCGGTTTEGGHRLRACDDGGTGGVVIDGVCL